MSAFDKSGGDFAASYCEGQLLTTLRSLAARYTSSRSGVPFWSATSETPQIAPPRSGQIGLGIGHLLEDVLGL
jgi:hypothetical protein